MISMATRASAWTLLVLSLATQRFWAPLKSWSSIIMIRLSSPTATISSINVKRFLRFVMISGPRHPHSVVCGYGTKLSLNISTRKMRFSRFFHGALAGQLISMISVR